MTDPGSARWVAQQPGYLDGGPGQALHSALSKAMDRLELVEIIHDATPVEADGGVPDVCNRMPEHEAVADAILAKYGGTSQELATIGGEKLRTVVKPAVLSTCYPDPRHSFIAMDGLLFCSGCGRGPVE